MYHYSGTVNVALATFKIILKQCGLVCSDGHNKIPHAGRLEQQKLISHSSRGRKSKIKMPANPGPDESLFFLLLGGLLTMPSQGRELISSPDF